MKKSTTITLVLVTSTLFLGCEENARNRYNSLEDCLQDYKDPTKCYTEKTGAGSVHYYGPWFRGSSMGNPSHNPSVTSKRAIGVVRGGWGSTGFSSGS